MAEDVELEELRAAARVSGIYHADIRKFRRNTSLTGVVHGVLHLSEFASVLAVELFHHIHHAVNRKLREDDPHVPHLPEERNLIFFGLPICMTVSLLLSAAWFFLTAFSWKVEVAIFGCLLGTVLMLLSGIFAMRHAEIHINLEEVSDDELLVHPIFIHNFVICILSIFSLMLYLIHFWILYDCFRWERKHRRESSTTTSSESSGGSESIRQPGSSSGRSEVSHEFTPIPTWDGLHLSLKTHEKVSVEDEPVVLYCCCLDLCNYLMHERHQSKPTHEFQVVHVV